MGRTTGPPRGGRFEPACTRRRSSSRSRRQQLTGDDEDRREHGDQQFAHRYILARGWANCSSRPICWSRVRVKPPSAGNGATAMNLGERLPVLENLLDLLLLTADPHPGRSCPRCRCLRTTCGTRPVRCRRCWRPATPTSRLSMPARISSRRGVVPSAGNHRNFGAGGRGAQRKVDWSRSAWTGVWMRFCFRAPGPPRSTPDCGC